MITASIRSFIRFRHPLLLLTLSLIATQCWVSIPAHAAANETQYRIMLPLMLTTSAPSALDASIGHQVLTLTNALRQQHGCPALQLSPELTSAAQGHSQDMADHNYFNHIDGNGNTPKERAQQAGYLGNAGTENIAAGYATAEDVVMGWYNEAPPNDGHRRNLLNCSLTDIGIGYAINPNSDYGSYWTQDLGQR
jgi:uncharacterized protein YkwD